MPKMPTRTAPNASMLTHSVLATQMKQAISLHTSGDIRQAARIYQGILARAPNHFDATHLLAVVCSQLRDYTQARTLFDRALQIRPGHAEALFNLGTMEKEKGACEEAVEHLTAVLAQDPDHIGALNNRCVALQKLQRHDEALADSDRLITLQPENSVSWNNRGHVLLESGQLEEALACFDRALEFTPDYYEALNNRGNTYADMKKLDRAIADYDLAIKIDDQTPDAHFNKGLALLLSGDLPGGWPLWEWRWRQPDFSSPPRDFSQPLWLGDEEIAGRTLLLHSEQGLGDTIQFARYAPMVAARGARVILEAPESLHPLLAALPGVDRMVGKDGPLPPFDMHCPLMSLPLAFRTSLETIPRPESYIGVSDNVVAAWRGRLGEADKPRVALAWRGNPKNTNDRRRSLGLAELLAHLSPDIDWLCLHHDLTTEEKALLDRNRHLGAWLDSDTNLEDAAALCDLADHVMTVDTSFSHVAGALGKPTSLLLAFVPDWRWLLGRSDSPWYGNTTLYRQDSARHFGSVIQTACRDIETRLLGRS